MATALLGARAWDAVDAFEPPGRRDATPETLASDRTRLGLPERVTGPIAQPPNTAAGSRTAAYRRARPR